ncbi:MAG TPA: hypothetical protein PLQ67_00210 [Burkholderiaceae bacterium]|nr:hypothetical protein [Burkholderiaceae bacterium]
MAAFLAAVPVFKWGATMLGVSGLGVGAQQALKHAQLPGGKLGGANDVSYSRVKLGASKLEVLPPAVRPQELVSAPPKRAVLFQTESAAQTKRLSWDSVLLSDAKGSGETKADAPQEGADGSKQAGGNGPESGEPDPQGPNKVTQWLGAAAGSVYGVVRYEAETPRHERRVLEVIGAAGLGAALGAFSASGHAQALSTLYGVAVAEVIAAHNRTTGINKSGLLDFLLNGGG